MENIDAFEAAYTALIETSVDKKISLVNKLNDLKNSRKLIFNNEFHIKEIKDPGRPEKPELVRFQAVPKRDKSDLGMVKTIHAICHIEFNAINLALDAVYRFRNMDEKFYYDWIQVAFEEAYHFNLINDYLNSLGYKYGDFNAHNGLWRATHETSYDILVRMALVPRVLEARGLDVTPKIQKRFESSKHKQMVKILDVIFTDEIGHVKIGNYWFHHLCKQRNLDPKNTFIKLIKKHIGDSLRGPFNIEARKLADFSDKELEYLESL